VCSTASLLVISEHSKGGPCLQLNTADLNVGFLSCFNLSKIRSLEFKEVQRILSGHVFAAQRNSQGLFSVLLHRADCWLTYRHLHRIIAKLADCSFRCLVTDIVLLNFCRFLLGAFHNKSSQDLELVSDNLRVQTVCMASTWMKLLLSGGFQVRGSERDCLGQTILNMV
jgi:hypothetical protein